jgi:hypothetical protein
MRNLCFLAIAVVAMTGCATVRQPLLSTPAVSMTQDSVPKDSKTVDLGPVESKYCYGEPALSKKADSIGLMDEVILKAQQDKKASYIANANFSYEGTCIVLEGEAMKVGN